MNETGQANAVLIQQRNEIIETLEALKLKNAELKETLVHLKLENHICINKFQSLSQRVNGMNGWLEKSGTIFHSLFEDTKNALRMGRSSAFNSTFTSPLPESPRQKSVAASPKPGPSGVAFSRRKFHIERLNIRELEQRLEENSENSVAEKSVVENTSPNERDLSTVTEENNPTEVSEKTLTSPRDIAKEVYVRLNRLSTSTVQEYLQKSEKSRQKVATNSLNTSCSFSSTLTPELTSTPLKLETMKQLGLYYTGLQPIDDNFINVRRKENVNQNENKTGKKRSKVDNENSPIEKKKTRAQEKNETLNINKKKNQKSKNVDTQLGRRSPKIRKARPLHLKEPPLGKKLRNG